MKSHFILIILCLVASNSRSQSCGSGYVDPNFSLSISNPDCNPNSGRIEVTNVVDGVAPFTFKIVELNITNTNGLFNNLPSGAYTVELRDACGTVRTRQVTLVSYQFDFSFSIIKVSSTCRDGILDISHTGIGNGFTYGYVIPGKDTLWSSGSPIPVVLAKTATIIVKDACGNMVVKSWTAPAKMLPYISDLQYRLQCDKVDIFPVYYGFEKPEVCLYETDWTKIECKSAPGNYTGGALTNFFDVPYGKEYYIVVSDACYQDTMKFADMTSRDGSELNPYDWECNTFTMHVDGLEDTVCLYNAITNQLVSCKGQDTTSINPRTGVPWPSGAVWTNLPYGSYYAWIYDPCADSTFRIDSTVKSPFYVYTQTLPGCTLNGSQAVVNFQPGSRAPFTIKILYPDGTLAVQHSSTQLNNYVPFPASPTSGNVQVIAIDGCGNSDTSVHQQQPLLLYKTFNIKQKCPGVSGNTGSGDVDIETIMNETSVIAMPSIISYNNGDTLILNSYSRQINLKNYFSFPNLTSGIYVIKYTANKCGVITSYDTIRILDYNYPVQEAPHIVQCGNNSYAFKDTISYGIGPFTFEIIDTKPLMPSLLTGSQTSNIFQIPPGANLDSIKIRVIDFCGNSNIKTFPVQKIANCDPLGVKDERKAARIEDKLATLFPNPSKGGFTISISSKRKTNYRIDISNALGIKVSQRALYAVAQVNLSVENNFSPGIYFVSITDLVNGKTSVFKQIVQ